MGVTDPRILMAYQLSAAFIKKFAYTQITADHQQGTLCLSYTRHDEHGKILQKGSITFNPGPPVVGDTFDQKIFDKVVSGILTKYNSAINGSISHLDSVMQIEKQIAQEIIKEYRDFLLAPNPVLKPKILRLERLYEDSNDLR